MIVYIQVQHFVKVYFVCYFDFKSFISDIEKAFQQILPPPHDKDFVRLIWFKDLHELNVNNIETVEYQIHRLCRALFGVSSRPFLLTRTLTYHMTTFSLCIKF